MFSSMDIRAFGGISLQMQVIGVWCVQLQPSNQPSMIRVEQSKFELKAVHLICRLHHKVSCVKSFSFSFSVVL
jgi:hypothetical protein